MSSLYLIFLYLSHCPSLLRRHSSSLGHSRYAAEPEEPSPFDELYADELTARRRER
jgi:hypothetical protein